MTRLARLGPHEAQGVVNMLARRPELRAVFPVADAIDMSVRWAA